MTARLVVAVLSRIGTQAFALVSAIAVLLLMLRAAPGDAIDLVTTDAGLRARMAAAWHLDAALPSAVFRALTGDWGTSWTVRPGRPVADLVGSAATASLPVLLGSMAFTMGVGSLLGSRRRRLSSALPRPSAMPVFLLGWGVIVGLNELTFAGMQRGIINRPDWFSLPDTDSWLRVGLAIIVLAVGSGNLRAFSDEVASRLAEHGSSAAVETLTARGMPTRWILWRLLIPDLVLLSAERTAFMFGGLVILERIFGMPGLGGLFFEACVQRDQPLVLASGVVAAAGVVGVRVVADAVRMATDPRLRDTP